jgi:hypothetical protein
MGSWEMHTKCWFESLKGREIGRLGMDGRLILKWILGK